MAYVLAGDRNRFRSGFHHCDHLDGSQDSLMTKQKVQLPLTCDVHPHDGYGSSKDVPCPWCEIAKLREWHTNGRANIEYQGDVVRICQGHHERHEPCSFLEYRLAVEPAMKQEGDCIHCGGEHE
jgi:hypothetical protein